MKMLPGENSGLSQRGQSDRAEVLLPYQYEMIFALIQEPLTAAGLGCAMPGRWRWSAQQVSPRLRPLVKRGWVERDDSGVYRATQRAIEAVSW
jgi:hypothetical protein